MDEYDRIIAEFDAYVAEQVRAFERHASWLAGRPMRVVDRDGRSYLDFVDTSKEPSDGTA